MEQLIQALINTAVELLHSAKVFLLPGYLVAVISFFLIVKNMANGLKISNLKLFFRVAISLIILTILLSLNKLIGAKLEFISLFIGSLIISAGIAGVILLFILNKMKK